MAVRSTVKSVEHQVKECVKKIPDEDLRWLSIRFRERVGSDLAEALLLIQERYNDLNRVLANTPSADAVYEIADLIDKHVQDEVKKRNRPSKGDKKDVKDKEVKDN
jgi:hypothetical protein